MKKLKIKNPVLRGLAGAGILIIGLVLSTFICNRLGQFLKPVYAAHFYSNTDPSFASLFFDGFITVASVVAFVYIFLMLYHGSIWLGNWAFNNKAAEK